MQLGCFCVADSVALLASARQQLRALSRQFGYYGCLLIFQTPLEVCLARDTQRTRQVGERVIQYHASLLEQMSQDAAQEHWEMIRVLSLQEQETLEIRY
jgi:predicted kinase